MMKNWKKIAAMLVVLAVFLAAFIYLNRDGKLDDGGIESPEDTVNKVDLVDISRDQIIKMILKRGDEEIILTREEREIEKLSKKDDGTTEKVKEKTKVWISTSFDVDSSAADSIALAAETAITKRLIDENPQDVTIYGLDNPIVTTVVSSDGEEYGIEIGKKTPAQDAYYIRKTGSTAVYTLDSYKGDTLSYGRFDILNKNLYGSQAVVPDDITSLTFTKDGKLFFDSKKNTSATDWLITAPLPERGAEPYEFVRFLDWLAGLKVSRFIMDSPSDLKAYGLENPRYVLDYTLNGKSYTLNLGTKIESDYYAMMDGNPLLFTISSSELNFIDTPLIDLVSTFAYIPTIYEVEKLVIELDGRVDVLLINDDKDTDDKDEFYFNGRKIANEDEERLFRDYYEGAIGITGDKVDVEARPSADAAIRLTYTMKEAKPDKVVTVELIPTGDGYGYYIMKNGLYTGLVMGERQLDDEYMGIRPAYEKLMEGLSKTE